MCSMSGRRGLFVKELGENGEPPQVCRVDSKPAACLAHAKKAAEQGTNLQKEENSATRRCWTR